MCQSRIWVKAKDKVGKIQTYLHISNIKRQLSSGSAGVGKSSFCNFHNKERFRPESSWMLSLGENFDEE